MNTLFCRYTFLAMTLGFLAPAVQAKSHHMHKHAKTVKPLAKQVQYENRLHLLARGIDRDTEHIPQDAHIEALATHFHVPLSTVEDLQKQGEGWGTISISLAMANALYEKNHAHFAGPADTIGQIQTTLASSKNRADASRRLGITLQSILAETSQSYREIMTLYPKTQTHPPTTVALAIHE
jgi:hypothetical protein